MPAREAVIAVDQGTSSTKAVAVDAAGIVLASERVPVGQGHPRPGCVEQDGEELATSVVTALQRTCAALEDRGVRPAAIGLSTQRESALVWDRATGRPVGPMLGWQDRRTAAAARAIAADRAAAQRVQQVTGLPLDPMFSALKVSWLLDAVDPDRSRSRAGALAVGTVDAWLVARLTGEHRIEAGNASRTQVLDVATATWDEDLLDLFRIPAAVLPRVVASDEPTRAVAVPGVPAIRVTGVLGDSHAALYGHGIREPGAVKVTLGTGSSVMGLGDVPAGALARTIAWATGPGGRPVLAFEGNILSAGSTFVWLAGILGVDPGEVVRLGLDAAAASPTTSCVDLVPAVAGLGAPWWDDRAQAVISGFDLGTDRSTLALAAVDALPLQVEDVLAAADAATGRRIGSVHVDGGPASDDRLVQRLADLTGRTVVRPAATGLSALGAAALAGRAAGLWDDLPAGTTATFAPALDPGVAASRRDRWRQAVARARLRPRPSEEDR